MFDCVPDDQKWSVRLQVHQGHLSEGTVCGPVSVLIAL